MAKRILSLLLIFTLALSCLLCTFAVSADSEQYGNEALIHMRNLGILSANCIADEMMTRGEFAQAVYKIVGNGVTVGQLYSFSDLSTADPYYDAIQFCVQSGYMYGDGGLFRSGDPITYIEGMTVMARVLNYTEYAKNNGDYTLGYYTTAKNIGLLNNTGITSSNDSMYVKNAAAMLYNALRISINKLSSISSIYYTYNPSDIIFAYDALGLNYAAGVMTSNGYADVSGRENPGKYAVIIDNKEYSSRLLDDSFRFYIGQNVSIFYDDDANIVSLAPTGKSNVVNINRADFSGKSGSTIEYYQNDRLTKAAVSPTSAYLRNGESVIDFSATGFSDSEYADMTLIDHDGDSIYDYILVNVYNTFVVHSVGSDSVMTSVDGLQSVDLSDETGKEVYIYNSAGERKSVEDIKEDYVVSVIDGRDFVYIVFVNTNLSGILNSMDEYSVTVDGLVTEIPNGTTKQFSDVSTGEAVTVYIDFAGRVVFVTKGVSGSDGQPHGFLIGAEVKDNLQKSISAKIFTNYGEIKVYQFADSFKMDDIKCTANKLSALPGAFYNSDGSFRNTIVMYTLNSDGKINSITFPKTSLNYDEDGFIQTCSKEPAVILSNGTLSYTSVKPDGTYFAGKEFINTKTEVFAVPSDLNDEDSYAIITKANISLTSNLTWDVFHYSKYNSFADVAVIYGDYVRNAFDTPMSVVLSVGTALDEDGNEVISVKHFCQNVVTVLTAKKDLTLSEYVYDDAGNKKASTVSVEALKPGDAVRLVTDKDRVIRGGERIYEYNASAYPFKGSSLAGKYATHSLYVTSGYVALNDKTLMRLVDNKADALTVSSDIFGYTGFIYSSAKIILVEDTSKGVSVKVGTSADLHIGDYVVYQSRAGTGAHLIIYRDR